MDLVDIIAEKRFLGQEFLTWLWFKSEEMDGVVEFDDGEANVIEAIIAFEKLMLLEAGEGENQEQVTCKGMRAELNEARTGLQMGKKLEQARIHLVVGEYEWHMTIKASRMEFRSMKFPKVMKPADDDRDEVAGALLDIVGVINGACSVIDDIFKRFVAIRISDVWPVELLRMNAWVQG